LNLPWMKHDLWRCNETLACHWGEERRGEALTIGRQAVRYRKAYEIAEEYANRKVRGKWATFGFGWWGVGWRGERASFC
jgi:hypothetical protein